MVDRERQKRSELSIALQAAHFLGEVWELLPREQPDFLVSSATGSFGLEITECQVGAKGKGGSKLREKESFNENWLKCIRLQFEKKTKTRIIVRYSGEVSQTAGDELLQELLSADFNSREQFKEISLNLTHGKAWASRSRASSWTNLDDRVGWVSNDMTFFQREIDKKARKLDRYRDACSDIRLLVVADRIYNSGKLSLPEGYRPDLLGFDAVYFFSYPEQINSFYR
ncbi:hypothetical protein [Sulfitobacter pontiacus]|uniref:hypothetical protein n=1 Tax=Sulfitobacter pontiacus TaxID=60137 RepID=UPI004058FF15